jgi:2-succinyl-5-enolpyruvyl-6-hydroxy-3-cyclohexene-1-carboxylate synthase
LGAAWSDPEAHLLGEWARLLFATLAAAGITDLFISPGSRSTPFAWLALQTSGLRCHSVIDERCAAFAALGFARASGRPAALLCTSGSAAANYYPAIVEASLVLLPMLVITADRPFEAQHSGAAQTIDQVKLYGNHVRRYFELGLPDAAASALVGLRRAVTQAVAIARYPVPGPVHLNARARKPLEPPRAEPDADHPLTARVNAVLATPMLRHAQPQESASPAALRELARALLAARAGVIVIGPLAARDPVLTSPASALAMQVSALASVLWFPILAEATSNLRFALADHPLACGEFAWLLGSAGLRRRFATDVVLSLGSLPACRELEDWLHESSAVRYVLGDRAAHDPQGNARLIVAGDLVRSLTQLRLEILALAPAAKRRSSAFTESLLEGGRRCRELLREELMPETAPGPGALMTEGAAIAGVARGLRRDSQWMLGNSLVVREVDAYVSHAAAPITLSQRGANGIDGLVSGAVGSALAAHRATLLLLGDVSLLHDLGGLGLARSISSPLVMVVIDNDGGRIFDQLPVHGLYARDAALAGFWRTPPRLDLAYAARLFGLCHADPTTVASLATIVGEALQRPAATLLQVRVAPDSARRTRERVLRRLTADLTTAVA